MFTIIVALVGILEVAVALFMLRAYRRANQRIEKMLSDMESQKRSIEAHWNFINGMQRKHEVVRRAYVNSDYCHPRQKDSADDYEAPYTHAEHKRRDDSSTEAVRKRNRDIDYRNAQDAAAVNAATSVIFFN